MDERDLQRARHRRRMMLMREMGRTNRLEAWGRYSAMIAATLFVLAVVMGALI